MMQTKEIKLPEINERIKKIIDENYGGNVAKFVRDAKIESHQVLNRIFHIDSRNKKYPRPSAEILTCIKLNMPNIDYDWLISGVGDMLKFPEEKNRKLIPFYDNANTIGGINEISANTESELQPTDYIDAGDWFKDATAAIRHYGESMTEYPQGSILALKEVRERQLIIWGKNYVIETNEYRITKRVQRGKSDGYVRAYSTNKETYPDGLLIHEPLDILWEDIHRIFSVLGYVVKDGSGTLVFSNHQNI
jgi:hypothetical protein